MVLGFETLNLMCLRVTMMRTDRMRLPGFVSVDQATSPHLRSRRSTCCPLQCRSHSYLTLAPPVGGKPVVDAVTDEAHHRESHQERHLTAIVLTKSSQTNILRVEFPGEFLLLDLVLEMVPQRVRPTGHSAARASHE